MDFDLTGFKFSGSKQTALQDINDAVKQYGSIALNIQFTQPSPSQPWNLNLYTYKNIVTPVHVSTNYLPNLSWSGIGSAGTYNQKNGGYIRYALTGQTVQTGFPKNRDFTTTELSNIWIFITNQATPTTPIANGLNTGKDYVCNSSDAQTGALQYLGDTATANTLYNLATQLKNILGANSTTNLFTSLNNLTNTIKNIPSVFLTTPATSIPDSVQLAVIKDINTICFYIGQLIALNNQSVAASTWATWYKQYARFIYTTFGLTTPTITGMATGDTVATAMKATPAFNNQITNVIIPAINSLKSGISVIGASEWTSYGGYTSAPKYLNNDIYNLSVALNNNDIPKVNGALTALKEKIVSNRDTWDKMSPNLPGMIQQYLIDPYNTIVKALDAIGYSFNANPWI